MLVTLLTEECNSVILSLIFKKVFHNTMDQRYSIPNKKTNIGPNLWDIIVMLLVFGLLITISNSAQNMIGSYNFGDDIPLSLDYTNLPLYASLTTVRMVIALFASLLFTFTVGTLAAKSKRAERIIIPFIDIMQSVPVIALQALVAISLIALFRGNLLGPECVAIFAIFTAQVWNMTLSFYQSVKTVPSELKEVARMFHLGSWKKFWRIEVPYAMPGLIWNTMISMSAGWFFVVESEAISANNQSITLKGIGSYINLANQQEDYAAFSMAILTMLLVILIYDQLIFRPLLAWSEKFKPELKEEEEEAEAWFLTLLQRARFINYLWDLVARIKDKATKYRLSYNPLDLKIIKNLSNPSFFKATGRLWDCLVTIALLYCIYEFYIFSEANLTLEEIGHALYLGFVTMLKIGILIIICTIIWVPIGVWIGLRPKARAIVQPFIQFLAAVPAQIFYPFICVIIITYNLNVEIWTTPLMILGTQWYILFNVIAGTGAIPKELRLAAQNYNVTGLLWWKKLILPAIFPYYVTGAMAAAGGCWNAAIVADVVSWGTTTLKATGIGAYIRDYADIQDSPKLVLGICVMCFYVLILNKVLWRRLYDLAAERFSITGN